MSYEARYNCMSQESRLTRGRNDSNTVHTYQEEKTGDSDPAMDKALVLGDDLPSCWGSVVAKNDAENCVAYQHSFPYFVVTGLICAASMELRSLVC